MFPIVGMRFTPAEFAVYVRGITMPPAFRPQFVVLHNTGSPTLAQRPDGFTEAHMRNLQDFYANKQKWSGGPHLFVDDKGVWVFNPLDRRGTHSPSWNPVSFGVEMLGDYDSEPFVAGRGSAVRTNAIAAVATLLAKIGVKANDTTLRLHKEDPGTTHDCPGKNVIKADFIEAVRLRMVAAGTPGAVASPPSSSAVIQPASRPSSSSSLSLAVNWTVIAPDGSSFVVDSTQTGTVRATAKSLGAELAVDSAGKKITLIPADGRGV